MSEPVTSEAIFDAARLGDRTAIAQLIVATQPNIRRFARRSCRTAADVEDATQEALWLLFKRVGTIRSLSALAAWLFTVVTRECMRLARRASGQFEDEPDETALESVVASRPDTELRMDLAAAIEALPTHYRNVLLLRDIKEMTIDEIVNALGSTRQAIKARLHRARLLVREYIMR